MLQQLEALKGERFSILAIVRAASLHNAIVEAVSFFTKQGLSGIYVSLTKPTRLLQEELKNKKIDSSKIVFMESMVDESNQYGNVVFMPSMEDLTGMMIAMDYFLKNIQGKKFVVLDSVDILQMYNDQEAIVNFIVKLVRQCATQNTDCIMMMSKKGDEKFMQKVTPLFEKVIYET